MRVVMVVACTWYVVGIAQKNPFLQERKKVHESRSKLKEQSVGECAAILHTLPELIKKAADMQQELMSKIEQYVEGQKSCFWDKASKEQLSRFQDQVTSFRSQLETMQDQLNSAIAYFKKLDS